MIKNYVLKPESFKVRRCINESDYTAVVENALEGHYVEVLKFLLAKDIQIDQQSVFLDHFENVWGEDPFQWDFLELKDLYTRPKMEIFLPRPEFAQYCATARAAYELITLLGEAENRDENSMNKVLLTLSGKAAVGHNDIQMKVYFPRALKYDSNVDYDTIINQLIEFHPDKVFTLQFVLAKTPKSYSIANMPVPKSGETRKFNEEVIIPYGKALDDFGICIWRF